MISEKGTAHGNADHREALLIGEANNAFGDRGELALLVEAHADRRRARIGQFSRETLEAAGITAEAGGEDELTRSDEVGPAPFPPVVQRTSRSCTPLAPPRMCASHIMGAPSTSFTVTVIACMLDLAPKSASDRHRSGDRRSASGCRVSAVDRHRRAGDMGSLVGGQEGNCRGHLLG